MKELTWRDLDPLAHTSFSFYDFLPGAGYHVKGAPSASQAASRIGQLLDADLAQVPEQLVDELSALLITHGHELTGDASMRALADATAHCFAAMIDDEARRPRRMRLTRLGLMLRTVLEREANTSGVTGESLLPCKSPWDFAENPDGDDGWIASSDTDNLRHLTAGRVDWSRREGLPTQLDWLGDGGLWAGSYYSEGGSVLRHAAGQDPQLEHIAHAQPLVLLFDAGRERWALDSRGQLWLAGDGAVIRPVMQLPMARVHRARVIDGVLFAFDWGQTGSCVRMALAERKPERMGTGDILICNDLCGGGGVFYAICKLQGKVFKMDAQGRPLGERLGAGTGPGRLLDPIMIRSGPRGLSVLNWFSAKLLRLDFF